MDYKKKVRVAMIEKDFSYSTLADAIQKESGMYCDQALLSRFLNGEVKRPWMARAIESILGVVT